MTPRGFIAPAWLLGAAAERAAADAEMEYTTRLTGVRDLRSGDNYSRANAGLQCPQRLAAHCQPGLEQRALSANSPERPSPASAFIRQT